MDDLVSIITPTYNSADFISATIDCILAQTYQNWELLITDDCSSDKTIEIVKKYVQKDTRIKLFQLENNSGGGVSRNNSIKQAKGRRVLPMPDTVCSPKLHQQVQSGLLLHWFTPGAIISSPTVQT